MNPKVYHNIFTLGYLHDVELYGNVQTFVENGKSYQVQDGHLTIYDNAEMPTVLHFREWKWNGKLHRELGPALGVGTGDMGDYYLEGVYISSNVGKASLGNKEFIAHLNKYLRRKKLEQIDEQETLVPNV